MKLEYSTNNSGGTVQEAVDLLNGFESTDDIAEFFAGIGIRGVRENGISCPISNWIRSTTGIFDVYTDVMVFSSDNFNEDPEFYELSDVAKSFIIMFDLGRYPDISIEPESP